MQNASQRDSVSLLRGISGIAAFSIAAFFIDILENREELLNKRLVLLNNYKVGIEKQLKVLEDNASLVTLANIERSKLIVEAEILGTKNLLSAILMEK